MKDVLEPRKLFSILFILAIAVVFTLQFGPGSSGFSRSGEASASLSSAARVNDREIPLVEFRQAYNRQLQDYRRQGAQVTPEMARQFGIPQKVLDQLINGELLAQAAERHGVTASDEELRKLIVEDSTFHKEGEFDYQMYQRMVRDYMRKTPQEYEEELRRQLAAQKLMGLVRAGVVVTDDELRARFEKDGNQAKVVFTRFLPTFYADKVAAPDEAQLAAWKQAHSKEISDYYEANRFVYKQPERIRARQILVKLAPEATEEQKAEARKRAESLRQQLEGGKDFATLASEASEDPGTKASGGDLGWVERGSWEPTLAAAAFALSEGQVTQPVETKFGIHLVKVEEKKAAQDKQLAEVEDEIARTLYKREQAKALAKAEAEKALAAVKGGQSLSALFPPEREGQPALKRFETETRPEAVETDSFTAGSASVPLLGPAPELLAAIFATREPTALDGVYPVGEGFVVAEVKERKLPDASAFDAKKEELRQQALRTRQFEEQDAFLKTLREQGSVVTNADAVDAVVGAAG